MPAVSLTMRKNTGKKLKKTNVLMLPAPRQAIIRAESPEIQADPRIALSGLTKIFSSIPGLFAKWPYDDEPPHGIIWKICNKVGLHNVKINTLTEDEYETNLDELIFSMDDRVVSDTVTVKHKYFTVKYRFPDLLKLELKKITVG